MDETTALATCICVAGPVFGLLALAIWLRGRSRIARLAADIQLLQQAPQEYQRQQWLAALPSVTYRNEIEVEVKFVAPLLHHLGYTPAQLDIRVSVAVQVGRQTNNGQADWIVWSADRRRPIAVVEAKKPTEPLIGYVLGQARSYAFALNAPLMILTNGQQLDIYRRGIQEDTLVVSTKINALAAHWPAIAAALQPDNVPEQPR